MGRLKELYLTVQENIRLHGQHLMGVIATEEGEMPFVYTIGNHQRGLPELLFVGAAGGDFGRMLNFLGEMMRERGKAFYDGEQVSLGGKFPVKIVEAGARARADFTIQVGQYYGTQSYRVQQIVLCDTEGRFPGDPGCAEPYASQLVLAVKPMMATDDGRRLENDVEYQEWYHGRKVG